MEELQNKLPLIIGLGLIVTIVTIFIIVMIVKSKKLKISNVYFISGAVKTGKSFLSVALALYRYLTNVISFYIKKFFHKELIYFTFHKNKALLDTYAEYKKPMLYSNMPLRYVKFNRFTFDILLRKVRIPNKSVVLLDETSLIADSMLFNYKYINDALLLFYKLWGHYSHGGTIIANSQSWSDNHFSLKRCMSRFTYIYCSYKLPFVIWLKVKEMVYSEDMGQVNTNDKDFEESGFLNLFIPSFIYKFYDCYYLSAVTDKLAYQVDYSVKPLKKHDSLKVDQIVSLQSFAKNLNKELKENEKKK